MRYPLRFLCIYALSMVPLVGCSAGSYCQNAEDCDDRNVCTNDECIGGLCEYTPSARCRMECTEQGVRNAVARSGGPFTFDCNGPTTLVTEDTIVVNLDSILDGQGNLTLDGNEDHRLFLVRAEPSSLELRGITMSHGFGQTSEFNDGEWGGGAVLNFGTLTLTDSVVSGNTAEIGAGGIENKGILNVVRTTISDNAGSSYGGGIDNWWATATLTDSTVSGNTARIEGGGIRNVHGTVTLINTTVSGNTASQASAIQSSRTLIMVNATVWGNIEVEYVSSTGHHPRVVSSGTLVKGACDITDATVFWTLSHNIESPGNTCGFDQSTGLVNVSAEELNLGPLQNNGGPTETHALLSGSPAINQIPVEDCLDADGAPLATDQRGEPRPAGAESRCDVGSFEVQEEGE